MAALHRDFAERYAEQPPWTFDPNDYAVPPEPNRTRPQKRLHCTLHYESETRSSVVTDRVSVLFVPARSGWEVPAVLAYSTMEGERPPQVHVAALKWLEDEFAAELIGLSDRVLEVIPRQRPNDYQEALLPGAWLSAYAACTAGSLDESASIEEFAVYLVESDYWGLCWAVELLRLEDPMQRPAGSRQLVDAARDFRVLHQRRRVVGFDAGVDDE